MEQIVYRTCPFNNYYKSSKILSKSSLTDELVKICDKQFNIIKKFEEMKYSDCLLLIAHLIENNAHPNLYLLILMTLCKNKNKNIIDVIDYLLNMRIMKSLIENESNDIVIALVAISYNNYNILKYLLNNNVISPNIKLSYLHP